jgi:hypothetical protein
MRCSKSVHTLNNTLKEFKEHMYLIEYKTPEKIKVYWTLLQTHPPGKVNILYNKDAQQNTDVEDFLSYREMKPDVEEVLNYRKSMNEVPSDDIEQAANDEETRHAVPYEEPLVTATAEGPKRVKHRSHLDFRCECTVKKSSKNKKEHRCVNPKQGNSQYCYMHNKFPCTNNYVEEHRSK